MAKPEWEKFLGEIAAARRELDCDGADDACWFRGQAKSEYGLEPGLFRPVLAKRRQGKTGAKQAQKQTLWKDLAKKERTKLQDEVWEIESDIFWEAITQAPDLQQSGLTGWEALFLMQHHGFPTRLLDWSEVLGVAVYFAVSSQDRPADSTVTPAVWVLNPYTLNGSKISWYTDSLVDPRQLGLEGDTYYDYRDYMTAPMDDDYSEGPVAIYNAQRSNRMRAQSGRFTIHGRAIASLEELCPEAVRKVVLPLSLLTGAEQFLEHAGIFEHVLFPDLDGMARSIRLRYKFGRKPR